MREDESKETRFPGFKAEYEKGYFKYPNILGNYWADLTPVENLVLLFILRQTIGFQKMGDRISLRQIAYGIPGVSKGLGLSLSTISRALGKLEAKGFITVTKSTNQTNRIDLVEEEDPMDAEDLPEGETLF